MAMTPNRLYLASRSPRRRELLHQIGVAFETLLFRAGARSDPEVDETPQPDEGPLTYVERVALAKAAYARTLLRLRHLPPLPVLSADTTLELDGAIIGKPENAADAMRILGALSGRSHRVLTAVAVADWRSDRIESVVNRSEVSFGPLSEAEIRAYVATGEPLDKAGAYGIQGRAATFVARLDGSYSGVMGLPLYETAKLLGRVGLGS